jgi:hypothetical protein
MDYRGLRILFFVHGLITAAAGLVLVVDPGLIPSTVGIHLESSANLLAYLLAGAEFGFAVLSFSAARLADVQALRLVAWSCIAFQGSSGVLEAYAYSQGANPAILANVLARVVIVGLFLVLSSQPRSAPTAM